MQWASEEFGVQFRTGNSIFGVQQSDEAEEAVWSFLDGKLKPPPPLTAKLEYPCRRHNKVR